MNTQTIRAIVLDLDGTLIDTAPDFVQVLNRLRAEEGFSALPAEAIRQKVSDGSKALVTLGFDLKPEDSRFADIQTRLLSSYLETIGDHSVLFPGIEELLNHITNRGLLWGIATNKPELYTRPLLANMSLEPDCVICPDHVSQPKPHPESLYLAAEQLDCQVEQLIYVGDHVRDIECGNQAGCITIAAQYGYIGHDQNVNDWGADHVVASSLELLEQLQHYL